MEYDSQNFANHAEVLDTGKKRAKDMQHMISEMIGQMDDIWVDSVGNEERPKHGLVPFYNMPVHFLSSVNNIIIKLGLLTR